MLVDRRGPDECWPWTGYSEDGYGRFYYVDSMVGAHELALVFTTGESRHPGMDTCHSCDNPICCNPSHLRFASRQSNVDDMIQRGRQARGQSNGQARLTEAQVVEIRERHALGATGRQLALDYQIGEGAVQAILTGRNWKHAGGPVRKSHGNRIHGRYAKNE